MITFVPGAIVAAAYFAIGNFVLLVFHTDGYGKGKIDVGDYIKWQWLWPLPVTYVIFILIVDVAKKMAKKVRGEK